MICRLTGLVGGIDEAGRGPLAGPGCLVLCNLGKSAGNDEWCGRLKTSY